MYRWIVVVLMVAGLLSGCATVPRSNPEAETRLVVANQALSEITEERDRFFDDLRRLMSNISALHQKKGWSDMEEIIRSKPALMDSDDPYKELEKSGEMAVWSRRYSTPWVPLFTLYIALYDHCIAMEVRRAALLSALTATEARFLTITALEARANRYPQGKAAYDTMDLLGKWADELQLYVLNQIGLYDLTDNEGQKIEAIPPK